MATAPPDASQRVRKMLVMGLGSTGTEICEALAQRLIEEFGGMERVPWIRFLCLETDQSAGKLMPEHGDLVTICIPHQDYQGNLASPGALNGAIQFETWADMATLQNIGDIQAGAGNIRMAGRLAFLYPSNFKNVLNAFSQRYQQLQALTETEAHRKRGSLPGGDDPRIRFIGNKSGVDGAAQDDDITVVVVGSLCGGTSSGIAVDMGYFVEKHAPLARRLALFSLPRWDLNVASYPGADRLKKNAYSALKELYHFSQIGTNRYSVKYPTEQTPSDRNQCYPYGLILLGWPDAASHEAEAKLNQTMAERLFANAFCPEADPFVAGVDGAANREYGKNKDQHTLFCTFGMSVLEFPAPRLVEYGAARLLHQTLQPWLEHQIDRLTIEADATACGLDYDHLKAALLARDPSLGSLLQTRIAEVVEKAKREPSSFSVGLAQLQAGFGDHTGGGEHATLPYGAVPQRLQQAQGACVDQAWEQVRGRIMAYLQDWQKGPRHALDFLSEVKSRLSAAKEALPGMLSTEPGNPDASAHAMHELRDDFCVRLVLLATRAINDAGEALRGELSQHVKARLERVVAQVMGTGRDVRDLQVPGVLDALQDRIDILSRRLENLCSALTQYAARMQSHAEVQRVPPTVKGVCLMKADAVDRVYGNLLAPNGDASALESAEKARGAAMLARFAELGAKITEVSQPCEWDSAEGPNARLRALPTADRERIEAAARGPFQSLLGHNVFAQWSAAPDREGIALECVRAAELCLSPDATRAAQMKGSPLHEVKLLIRPEMNSAAFDAIVGAGSTWDALPGSESTRAIFLHEVYCIPPEALRGITSTPAQAVALEAAAFEGFYTFTRKDVSWGPMSETEWLRLEKCEQLLSIAIQIRQVRVSGGSLLIDGYPRRDMGDPPHRKLSRHFPDAVRQWALIGLDNENLDLSKLEMTLSAAIGNKINMQGGEQFVSSLNEGLAYRPEGVTGWETREIGPRYSEFCERNTLLKPYHNLLFAPPAHVLEAVWYEAGQRRVTGRPADAAGYYCISPECGGAIGRSRLEAAHAEWHCPVCNHDYSMRGDVPSDWMNKANTEKSLGRPQPPASPSDNGKRERGVFAGETA